MDVLQRIRELGVQGANGIYDASQLAYMGEEVDQLLAELVTIGNARDESGNYLFSGTAVRTEPFRLTHGRVPGGSLRPRGRGGLPRQRRREPRRR